MTFWEGWLAVRTKALTGEALEEASRQASEAMEVARKVADHNLQALRGASSVPRPQDVPVWRWVLLLYLPEKSNWLAGYYYRAIFLACILCLLWILKQYIVIANYVQLRDAGLFLSSMLTKGLIQLLAMEMGVLLIGAMLMQHIAHSESISLRPIEIEKI